MDPSNDTLPPTSNGENSSDQPATPGVHGASGTSVGSHETPAVVTSSQFATPAAPAVPPKKASKRSRKKLLFMVIPVVVVLLAGSAAAYYFGYYKNASLVYSQSLSNTGKAYTSMITYLTKQQKVNYKGVTGSGSYKFKDSSFSTDGTVNFNSDGSNSDTKFNIGLAVTRVNLEIRTIKAQGDTNPDIYLNASGISGLGSLLGSPELDQTLNNLNGKWIVIDHTLLDNLQSKIAQTDASKMSSTPSEADVISELQAFGNVNNQYVFTTNKSKAVTEVIKNYGLTTINGHKVFHYLVGFNKANVEQYITAQEAALKASSLGAWLASDGETSAIDSAYKSLETSAGKINASDTINVWSDINSRLIYQVRVSSTTNPAANFVDVGVNYKSGNSIPFFLDAQSSDNTSSSTTSLAATVNTATNAVSLNLNISGMSSGSPESLSGSFNFTPTNNPVALTAPTGAETLSQILDQLGLGGLLDAYLNSPTITGSGVTNASGNGTSISL
jgi:hypothetical protein